MLVRKVSIDGWIVRDRGKETLFHEHCQSNIAEQKIARYGRDGSSSWITCAIGKLDSTQLETIVSSSSGGVYVLQLCRPFFPAYQPELTNRKYSFD